MSTAQKLQMDMEAGHPQEVVFNNNMMALVRAARVCDRIDLTCVVIHYLLL